MPASAMVIGEFGERDRALLDHALARAAIHAVFFQTVTRALLRLRASGELPVCVIALADLDMRKLVDGVREGVDSFGLPVIGLLAQCLAKDFRDAYLAGADDAVCAHDYGGLTRRLANLAEGQGAGRPAATLGRAVIASRDETRRRQHGRTLRQVGFEVSYASELAEATQVAPAQVAPAFVVSTEQPPPGMSVARNGSGARVGAIGPTPVLFLSSDDEMSSGGQVADVTGRLLFFADEAGKAAFKDRRASPRLVHATVCSFREGGLQPASLAVTHNLSREGMYIRTLDPLKLSGPVWVELCPPRSESPVHLRARVIWRRLPGSGQGVLPPGFGVRIDAAGCPGADLAEFMTGYEQLVE